MDILEAAYSYRESELAKAAGIYPFFRVLSSSEGPVVTVEGRRVVMLGSNNYLGLTHHPEVLKAAHDALDRYGTSCTGSRFLNGNLDLHETLERELAEFTGKQAAVVFSSGFLANLGTIGLLGSSEGAVIFLASESHASLCDGARMARSRRVRFFTDVEDLARQLAGRALWPHALVVTDGVFSMTGREADLRQIAVLKRRFGFRLYVDDAHGLGVLGPQGRGTAAHQGVGDAVDLLFGTFSKSFASLGGFIAGDRPVIEYLRHRVRTLIFSAALPPASAAAALTALRVMQRDAALFERLWQNVEYFRASVERIGYQTMGTTTPIIPLFIGSEAMAMRMCCEALQLGLFATPAVYPAVPKGHALIRTSVTPAHTREHLDEATEVLARLAERHPIPKEDPSRLPAARKVDLGREIERWLSTQAPREAGTAPTQPPL
jgi:8-amino-7-oxononanoate synthase